jgi:hypothetical protein
VSANKGSGDGGSARKTGGGGKTSAAPARDTSSAAPSTAPAVLMDPTLGQRLGNRGLQAMLQSAGAGEGGEPSGAAAQRAWMGSRFGLSFADVRLRDDAQSHATAHAAHAQAYAQAGEVGFARGRWAPHTPDGRRTLAHEFAHVAQFRGGHPGMPALPTRGLAEWQAEQAAATVMAGGRPRVSAFRGDATRLYDDGKRSKSSAPSLTSADDEDTLKVVLKMLDTLPDGPQRGDAMLFLVALAMQPGPAQERAGQRLTDALTGTPTKRLGDHMAAVLELQEWTKDVRAYEFLLLGRFWWADRSKDEIGSTLVVGSFQRWLHYAKGKWCIQFLQRHATGADAMRAHLAARIVADLLQRESDPKEKPYRANYAALREMARANGWEAFGALGGASATPRIFSALEGMRQQADDMAFRIEIGPYKDPWRDADVQRLRALVNGLSTKGPLSRTGADGQSVRLFTAENDEETEHDLLKERPMDSAQWLLEMARTYTVAVDLGARVQQRIEVLHASVDTVDAFLGSQGWETDERLALLELRHEYIEAWLSVTDSTFKVGDDGVAADYENTFMLVDRMFERFDEMVSKRKFRTALDQYRTYKKFWAEGKEKYPSNDQLDESFFFTMQATLEYEKESLDGRFFGSGFGTVGGMPVIVVGAADMPLDRHAPKSLNTMVRWHQDVALFGLQSALFLVYATNLSVHNMIIKADVGSSSFQRTQGKRLMDMRTEMEDFWRRGAFDEFMTKTDGYEQTLKSVIQKVQDRARLDLLLNLAITLVAALVTMGVGLAVRLATLSRTLALARTARAVASVSTLMEVGVFTASELTMRNLVFGKDITLDAAVKSAGTNLLFLGALKLVGTLASGLIKGSPLRQLMMGHLVGFSGTAAVSATLTRIETGRWPPDMAMFLAQTGGTYLLLAGTHHAFQSLVTKPVLSQAATTRLETLKVDNEALKTQYEGRVNSGTLRRADFEAIRNERIRLVEETRAVGRTLKDANLMSAKEFAGVERMADDAVALAKDAKFPDAGAGGADPVIKALPAPDSVIDLVRVGDSDTYVYDPSRPTGDIDTMLATYESHGFKVQGNQGLRRVIDGSGRTHFLLTTAPMPSMRLLPSSSTSTSPTDSLTAGPLERATALTGPALDTARAQLKRVSPQAEAKLPLEYEDHNVLATISVLLEHAPLIKEPWSIDATRGLADALVLERGITRTAVRRLFMSVPAKDLPTLLAQYHDIVSSPNVKPGSQFLIGGDLLPKNSLKLIDAYRQLKAAGVELPPDMDLRATRGLLRQIEKMPGGWLPWIKGLAKEKRGYTLRALSGLNDPRVRLPENMLELMDSITADLPGHQGLNPLAGANGDAFVTQLETTAGGGKFDNPNLRRSFVNKVDSLRQDVALLQQGRALQHGEWENVVGRANEVRQMSIILLGGATVHVADQSVGPKGQLPSVNLANYPLPGGGKVINAPADMNVHMDLVFTDPAGALVAMELTTAELGLPSAWSSLDPQSPNHGADLDWSLVDTSKAHDRKFMQAVKIYQLNKMATEFSIAWSNQPVPPAEMRIQAGDFSVPAARALESLGFRLERTDGKRETALQIEARKKPGKKSGP